MRYLRTNTATRVTIGPFIDKTDGITPEVALTVTSEHLTLMVDTAGVPTLVLDVAPTASAGANDMVHITGDDAGFYDLELAAADVNYVGRAMLSVNDVATHCPVFHEFMILPANVYDAQVLGSDLQDVAVTEISDALLTKLGIVAYGTAQSATGTTLVLAAASAFADDELNGAVVVITGGTGIGQSRVITDYVSATDTATVDTWATTPSGTITYVILAAPPASATALPAVTVGTGGIAAVSFVAGAVDAAALAADVGAEIGTAVWATAARTLTAATNITSTGGATVPQTGDSFARLGAPAGASVSADIVAVKTKTDNLPVAPAAVGSAMTLTLAYDAAKTAASQAQVNAEVVDAIATDARTEPLAVPAANASMAAKVDWLFLLARNKRTQTATTASVRNDADGADVAAAAVADDGTTFTQNKWA